MEHLLLAHHGDENALVTPAGKGARAAQFGATPGGLGPRGSALKPLQASALKGGSVVAGRRAFGDITNGREAGAAAGPATGAKPGPAPAPLLLPLAGHAAGASALAAGPGPAAPGPAAAEAPRSALDALAERYATEGVERLSGMGGAELAREAEARDQARTRSA